MSTKTESDPVAEVDPVADAEAAAFEAEQLVAAIEDRIMRGDETVTHEELTKQISVAQFARKLIEGAKTRVAQSQAAKRLDAANKLHDEINAHALGIGGKLAEQARTYYESRHAFLEAAAAHNAAVSAFTMRAQALDVPRSIGRPVGFARDGRLQLPQNGDGIHAGRRRLSAINGAQYLEQIDTRGDIDGVVASLSLIDAELPEPEEGAVHFRGSGGGVFTYSPDNVPTAEEIKRNGLVKVTAAEAWGADDE